MKVLPDLIIKEWNNRKGPIILTTVNKENIPNSIYATCVSLYNSNTICIADNYLNKTKQNILDGSYGVVLFITEENKSYQIKGQIEYIKEGELYDDMKKWNPKDFPGHAVVALKVEQAYSGAEKLL
ncbi:MAG: pyridoxamine 5'-phosphate oxidase family protein [Spirochaetales bacterium]|nr:pyridoxamine 5'-phosphate oxidase family protein [Spirochaetales bacterium]